jgi:hypothetical protein
MPQEFATEFLNAVENGRTILLGFLSLNIPIYRKDQPDKQFRMPIWDGIVISRSITVISKVVSPGGRISL